MADYTPAQERLIEKYRDINVDHDWWDCEYEDFKEVAKSFGIPVDDMCFRLAYSQGDGACFDTHSFTLGGILKAGRDTVTGTDYGPPEDYKGTVKAFYDLFLMVEQKFGTYALVRECAAVLDDATTRVTLGHSHYEHSGRMDLDGFEENDIDVEDDDLPEPFKVAMGDIEKELRDALRECADALYNSLRDEYEYQTEDEQVWEAIVANGLDSELEDDEDDEPEDTPLPFKPPTRLEDWLPALQQA